MKLPIVPNNPVETTGSGDSNPQPTIKKEGKNLQPSPPLQKTQKLDDTLSESAQIVNGYIHGC